MSGTRPITLTVNGVARSFAWPPEQTLLDVLRDDLGLTGTKECCLVGECGACTVSLNGRIVDSCLVLAVEADGCEVTTIEGLAGERQPEPGCSRLSLTAARSSAASASPGQVMAARDLLARMPHPSVAEIQEGLAGNLCRCACYGQITDGGARSEQRRAGPSERPRRNVSRRSGRAAPTASPAGTSYLADIQPSRTSCTSSS